MMVEEADIIPGTALGRRGGYVVFLCCLLLAVEIAADDPLKDYMRACEGQSASEDRCTALVARISALSDPSPGSRLALFRARSWLGHYPGPVEKCNELRALADDLADHPDVLFELAACSYLSGPSAELRGNEKNLISRLQATLVLAPDHKNALDLLVYKIRALGYGYGVDAAALAGYATALYEITGGLDAAVAVFEATLDAGDPEKAEAIRERVRRDLELDALDHGQRRQDSLALACSGGLFDLGLEDTCLSALEVLVETAADNGETIPPDVLGQVGDTFEHLEFRARVAQRSGYAQRAERGAERARGVLDDHPEPLRSSEHYRVYATTAPTWGDRIGALRRAVELDGGNLDAMCELAGALVSTGARSEAWLIYANLAADDRSPCGAEEAMQDIEFVEKHGVLFTRVSPDDPFLKGFSDTRD